MATWITESGNSSTDGMRWKVVYGNGETTIKFYIKKDGDAAMYDVFDLNVGGINDMEKVITLEAWCNIPRDYVTMMGDSLSGLQRVFSALDAMNK